jgi:hypothetical protein
LEHVAFDLRFLKLDIWIVEEAGQIVIHIWCDHVKYGAFPAFSLWPFYRHLFELQDIVMRQHLQQLDFSQRRDRKAVFLIVHQNLFEREDATSNPVSRLVDFAKSSLAELLHHLVLANLGASLESSLQTLLRRRSRRVRHCGRVRFLSR